MQPNKKVMSFRLSAAAAECIETITKLDEAPKNYWEKPTRTRSVERALAHYANHLKRSRPSVQVG